MKSLLVFCVNTKKRKSSTTAAAGETIPPGGSGGLTEIETPYFGGTTTEGCCTEGQCSLWPTETISV